MAQVSKRLMQIWHKSVYDSAEMAQVSKRLMQIWHKSVYDSAKMAQVSNGLSADLAQVPMTLPNWHNSLCTFGTSHHLSCAKLLFARIREKYAR